MLPPVPIRATDICADRDHPRSLERGPDDIDPSYHDRVCGSGLRTPRHGIRTFWARTAAMFFVCHALCSPELLSSELFPFSESQGALVSCTVHLAFILRNAPALRPGCTWTLVPTIPPVFRGLSACAGDRRGVLTSAPAILLQDEWAYETPTGTMQCRRHQGSLDATEPSLRRFRRTTDIRLGMPVFLGKFYISSYST